MNGHCGQLIARLAQYERARFDRVRTGANAVMARACEWANGLRAAVFEMRVLTTRAVDMKRTRKRRAYLSLPSIPKLHVPARRRFGK